MPREVLKDPVASKFTGVPLLGLLWDTFSLARPSHWVKNVFLFAPLVFSGLPLSAVPWLNLWLTFVMFCVLSSSIYALNDVIDAAADRLHPRKRNRPIAAGRLSAVQGLAASLMLAGAAALIGWRFMPRNVQVCAAIYLANSLAYCLFLKHRILVDVLLIAIGFVLRLLAGCFVIGVEPSNWLLVCGFALAMVLGFGKRRVEVTRADVAKETRRVLTTYTPAKLDTLLSVSVAVCLLAYILFTISPETIARHGSNHLVYTVPIVVHGLFRYMLVAQDGKKDGPTEILTRDPVFLGIGSLWLLVVILVLHGFI
jgi:4-hydroxybenzoate polyprenyltransferase